MNIREQTDRLLKQGIRPSALAKSHPHIVEHIKSETTFNRFKERFRLFYSEASMSSEFNEAAWKLRPLGADV